jgi:type IV pilus assembly protein PilW
MIKQRGLSLVELMIAMALGLILTLGVIRIFISSKQTYTVVTSQSQAQENARVARHFLGRALRHAGYWDDPTVFRAFPVLGGLLEENEVITVADNDSTNSNIVDGTDSIVVRFNGSADGSMTTCLGESLDETQIAVNRYYIGDAGASTQVPSLMCESYVMGVAATALPAPTRQPLITGVENLQVELGLGDQTSIREYASPSAASIDWGTVKSLRYALLTTSNQNAAGQEDTRTYTLVDGETVTASGDNRIRQVQRDSVYLRNFRSQ